MVTVRNTDHWDASWETEKKKIVPPECLSHTWELIDGGFWFEGNREAEGISWDRNILVANVNLSSQEKEHCLVFVLAVQGAPRGQRFLTLAQGNIFLSSRLVHEEAATRVYVREMEEQTSFSKFHCLLWTNSLCSLHPTRQKSCLPLKGEKVFHIQISIRSIFTTKYLPTQN